MALLLAFDAYKNRLPSERQKVTLNSMPSVLHRLFPFLSWARPTLGALQQDLWAGTSVGLVLVPQALAYATLAGMPPHTGLYAALLPAIIGVLWGSSSLLAVGPVALTSILVFGSLSSMAAPGSSAWIALAIWLSIYSGIVQFMLGAFRLGKIAYLVSQPVIAGFTNAAAVIIIASQLPSLLGLTISLQDGKPLEHLITVSPATLLTSAFGCAALALLVAFKRFAPRVPGILIVTVIGIVASRMLGYAQAGGAVVGELPSGFPPLSLPTSISYDMHRELWPAALILAMVSFTEAMSSCRILSRKTSEPWDENQELIGQGLAKITSGFAGAFPVSGSFSRSALNLYAGAVTPWASIFATLSVMFSLLFLTRFIADLPYSVLAAMIMLPVFNLLDIKVFMSLLRVSRDDAAVAIVTFIVTLTFSPRLHFGVFAGVGLTMISFLYRRARPRIVEVGQHPDGTLRDRSRFDLQALSPEVLALRMDSALNFLTAGSFERFITDRIQNDTAVKRVLICASGINDIDASGVEALDSLHSVLRAKKVELYMSNVKKQVWDVLSRAGFISALGSDHLFGTDREAILVITEQGQHLAVVSAEPQPLNER